MRIEIGVESKIDSFLGKLANSWMSYSDRSVRRDAVFGQIQKKTSFLFR